MDKEIHIENIERVQWVGYYWLSDGGHPNGNSGSVADDLGIKHFIPGPDNPLYLLDMASRLDISTQTQPNFDEK